MVKKIVRMMTEIWRKCHVSQWIAFSILAGAFVWVAVLLANEAEATPPYYDSTVSRDMHPGCEDKGA